MSVTTQHPLYAKYVKRWNRSRDFFDGEDAVKDKGETYLKRTGQQRAMSAKGQETEAKAAYEFRLDGAEVPDIYTPSIVGLTGLACTNDWEIQIPPAMNYLEENCSGGIPMHGMKAKLIQEGLKYGRKGHFIDSDPSDNELRIALYDALAITNWKRDNNRLNLVVLTEEHDSIGATDIFTHDKETHYRVLRIGDLAVDDKTTLSDQYIVDVYKIETGVTDYSVHETFTMDFQEGVIPFVFQGSTGLEVDPDVIPLEGMLLQCWKYYKLSADLYHDIHMSNTSTLFGKGFEAGDISFAGSGATIITANTDADLKFVATEGRGQKNAIAMMDRKIEMAEKQSHRMTDTTGGVEASSTLRQKTASKTATLRSVEEQAVEAFEKDLKFIAMMKGLDPNQVSVKSKYDYTDEQVNAVLYKAISESVIAGTTPQEDFNDYKRSVRLTERDDKEIDGLLEDAEEKRQANAMATDNALFGDEAA